MNLNKNKLPIIKEALIQNNVDAWLIIGRESVMRSEPILPVLGDDLQFIIASAMVFTQERLEVVCSKLDEEGFKLMAGIDQITTYQGELMDGVMEVILRLNPKRLAVNYSKNDASADGLTYGIKRKLDRYLMMNNFKGELVSAHPIISKVRGMKTPEQITKIQHTAEVALSYLLRVPEVIVEGSTSLTIFNFLQDVAYKDGYTMSWTPSQCPGVSVDPNVAAGHMGLIDTPIIKGYLINLDYGVAKDGYCSDLQRMYYVLKDDEVVAPAEAIHAFETVKKAIEMAKAVLKPGITGFEVDKVARDYVVENGYESWNAALGHQVGHQTHDGGTILANRRERYNRPELIDVPLDEGNVFTIEPGVSTTMGRLGIEEMAVITKDGARWLVPPQQELILIRMGKA